MSLGGVAWSSNRPLLTLKWRLGGHRTLGLRELPPTRKTRPYLSNDPYICGSGKHRDPLTVEPSLEASLDALGDFLVYIGLNIEGPVPFIRWPFLQRLSLREHLNGEPNRLLASKIIYHELLSRLERPISPCSPVQKSA